MPTTTDVTVEPDSNYYALSSVMVRGDEDLQASNIKDGTSIFGVEGTLYAEDIELESFTITQELLDRKYISLRSDIVVDDSLIVFIDNMGITISQGSDYILVGNQIAWEGLGLDGRLLVGDVLKIQYKVSQLITNQMKYETFVLTDAIVNTLKYITIQGTITNNQSILLFIDNVNIKAQQGIDYSVNGNEIFWSSYDLDGKLQINDRLKVAYI